MNSKRILSAFISVLLLTVVSPLAQTASPQHAVPKPRPKPSPASILQKNVTDLQYQPDDRALREKTIAFALNMTPAPVTPTGFQDEMGLGTEAMKQPDAASLEEAAKHFSQAGLIAPWLPDSYSNLAAVDEKLEKFEDARVALGFYLLAAPQAGDAETIRNRIAQLAPDKILEGYVAGLQKNPADDALRTKLIKFALQMNPAPAIPDDALRASARGRAAIEMAKSPDDMKDAVDELDRAVQSAPWQASTYSNLAIAQDKVEDYSGALKSLQFCLLASSNERDVTEVKQMMYELEYKQQKAEKERVQKAAAEEAVRRQQAEKQAMLNGLNGEWVCAQGCTSAVVTAQGETFRIDPRGVSWTLGGVRKDLALEGTVYFPGEHVDKTNCDIPPQSNRFTGSISEDGSKITVQTQFDMYMTHALITGGLLFRNVQCDDMHVDHKENFMFVLVRKH